MYGVAITSAIVQTTLSIRLPDALGEIPDKWRVRPFSLRCAVLCCECEAGNKLENTDARARRRSLTKSDTPSRPSRRCPRMCSSRRATSTTTDSATPLQCPRRLPSRPCVRPSSLGRRGFGAQSEPWLGGRKWTGPLQSRVSGFGKRIAATESRNFEPFQVVKIQSCLVRRGNNLKIERQRLQVLCNHLIKVFMDGKLHSLRC